MPNKSEEVLNRQSQILSRQVENENCSPFFSRGYVLSMFINLGVFQPHVLVKNGAHK